MLIITIICIFAQYVPRLLTLSYLATGVPRRILWDYPEKAYFHIWWARAWAVDIGFARYRYRRPQGQHWIPQISAFIPSNSGKENFSLHNHFESSFYLKFDFYFRKIIFFSVVLESSSKLCSGRKSKVSTICHRHFESSFARIRLPWR